jgi:hypothetical protein
MSMMSMIIAMFTITESISKIFTNVSLSFLNSLALAEKVTNF